MSAHNQPHEVLGLSHTTIVEASTSLRLHIKRTCSAAHRRNPEWRKELRLMIRAARELRYAYGSDYALAPLARQAERRAA